MKIKKHTILFAYLLCFVEIAVSQNVGIGMTTPAGKLHIKGSANISQLIIEANATQSNTSPLLKLRNSLGNDLLWIHSDTAFNTFIGLNTGRVNNATGGGINNTFIGRDAGYSNTLGYYNTAVGMNALSSNTIGHSNTAVGLNALVFNTTGNYNTAFGRDALFSNTMGQKNTSCGNGALVFNTTGSANSAFGDHALYSNTEGHSNTANGANALYSNINGNFNTAIGMDALYSNESGIVNTAIGREALYSNTTGTWNTSIGNGALYFNTTGSNNTGIGTFTGVSIGTLTNATALGYNASVNATNKVRIGSSAVSVIEGQVAWSFPSDGRFKENIEADVLGLDFIMKLQPVSYHFNRLKYAQHVREHLTPDNEEILLALSQIRSVGFIAQDVEKIIRETEFTSFDAVHAPTNETDNYSMGYAVFVVPLVKAVQEQQQQLEDMKKEIDLLKEQNKLLLQLIDTQNR